MHHVGIDLAPGDPAVVGLAVLDADGVLVHLSAEATDEAAVAALAGVTGACLVAIDAPLAAVDAGRRRPGEVALNADFEPFGAGTGPVRAGTTGSAARGARLAKTLGLDINPASRRARRAIEVHPPAAAVALFGLGHALPYASRRGRTLPGRRDALLALVRHVESLADADPRMVVTGHGAWQELAIAVAAARRKSDLARAESQVHAVLGAYVTRCALAGRTSTYGNLQSGYIVTPELPPGLEPTPDPPAVHRDPVQHAVQSYAEQRPAVVRATEDYVGLLTALLDEAGINYLTITGRTKSVSSFAEKAARTVDGAPVYPDPLQQITDQVGVRVITYVLGDVQSVAELLADQLVVLEDRDMGLETAREGRYGYASRHLLIALDESSAAEPEHADLRGRPASVQVRTVLQHAWAEFEHDIRYKGSVPVEHAPDLDRRFTLAAGLLDLADREFSTIQHRLQESMTDRQPQHDAADPRISAKDLAAFLAGRFPGTGWSRTEQYEWISGLLLELGIASLQELGALLSSADSAEILDKMGYRYPPGAVRRLDDALLDVFGERYLQLHGNAHRAGALRARLEKLRG